MFSSLSIFYSLSIKFILYFFAPYAFCFHCLFYHELTNKNNSRVRERAATTAETQRNLSIS